MVSLGSTFQANHLYVVISDPLAREGKCVLVNVTTQRPSSDQTCVLLPADFPSFIHHPSVVNYGDAILAETRLLEQVIANGEVRPHPDMAPALVRRIVEGALRSAAFPIGLQNYL